MNKTICPHWIKLHTIAVTESNNGLFPSGMLAIVDADSAGVVGYSCDSYYGFELGVDLTEMPTPHEILQIDPWDDWTKYLSRKEFQEHPSVVNFQQEINWIWEGTTDELYYAATHNTDLMFPDRPLSEQDSDYQELYNLYAQIRKHIKKLKRKGKI